MLKPRTSCTLLGAVFVSVVALCFVRSAPLIYGFELLDLKAVLLQKK